MSFSSAVHSIFIFRSITSTAESAPKKEWRIINGVRPDFRAQGSGRGIWEGLTCAETHETIHTASGCLRGILPLPSSFDDVRPKKPSPPRAEPAPVRKKSAINGFFRFMYACLRVEYAFRL